MYERSDCARWPAFLGTMVLLATLCGCNSIGGPGENECAGADAGCGPGVNCCPGLNCVDGTCVPVGGEGEDEGENSAAAGGEGEVEGLPDGSSGVGGPVTEPGVLTAGAFDDNLNLGVYEDFVSLFQQADAAGAWPAIDLGRRIIISVVNESGEPIGDARVVVAPADPEQQAQPLIDLPTRADGRVVFSTIMDGATRQQTRYTLNAYPPGGGEPVGVSVLSDADAWEVTLPGANSTLPTRLDLAFVVDATGSMADELDYLTAEVAAIAAGVGQRHPTVNTRYALVVYRDDGDEYLTRTFDFTDSLAAFEQDLATQFAQGGGDYPEAMHLALEEAQGLSWRTSETARVLFLIADAPPHSEFAQRTLDAVMALRSAGVAVYPVAASGVADEAEYLMRTAALFTLAEYCFLTDDAGVGNPHAEPHIPCYHVERLNDLMVREIASELSGQRIYPDPQDVLRTVGNPVDGVCLNEEGLPESQQQ